MSNQPAANTVALKRTPLHDLHLAAHARMVPFAGCDMPLQYTSGVLKEHLHTRAEASLFDVSHMGQVALRPRSGNIADAARGLEALVPVDVLGLKPGRQRYAFFTNADGGIIDDLIIGHCGDHFLLIVNASRKSVDRHHLENRIGKVCEIEVLEDYALLALQGPKSEVALAPLAPVVTSMRFMDVRNTEIGGIPCSISRSGYTGEDGFEISVPATAAQGLARSLLKAPAVALAGLGARDTLRLEAGLCLYGQDIHEATTPVEAALEWAIQKARRPGGARAGGFLGSDRVLDQLVAGAPFRRIGLKPRGRAPVRAGTLLYAGATAPQCVGAVTSGGFGPSLGGPVAMGYVPTELAAANTNLYAEVRGNRLPVGMSPLPFVPQRYKHT